MLPNFAFSGVVGGDVDGAADERGQRDQVLLGRLLGRGDEVPFDGEGRGEVLLRGREADDFLGVGVAEGTGVEVDLEGALICLTPNVSQSLRKHAIITRELK